MRAKMKYCLELLFACVGCEPESTQTAHFLITTTKDSNGLVKYISQLIQNNRGQEESEGKSVNVHLAKHVRKHPKRIILNHNFFQTGEGRENLKFCSTIMG